MKNLLIDFLKENIEININYEKILEIPKLETHGDFSFPCFLIAKELKKNPNKVAEELKEKLTKKLPFFLLKIEQIGPFLNFYLNNSILCKEILTKINSKEIFNFNIKKKEKILIEFPSPNTNKSLHVGHSRNILLGNSLCSLLKKVGNEIIKVNLNNDRGIAICKTMLSYKLFANNSTPKDLNLKEDEFVSHWYVKYSQINKEQPELELDKKAQEMLVLWENKDKETLELWEKILDWVYSGYLETYKNYKLNNFDFEFFESQIYDKGKEIVLNALKNNIKGFGREDDGAIFVDLTKEGLDKKYLLRGDLTTLYMTQDLYLANLKKEKFNADKYIFVVAQEQEYHFKVLFEILKKLSISNIEDNFHFAYGYVYDENGKKFSSRIGNTISADKIYFDILSSAEEILKQKEITKNLDKKELEKRAKIIGFSALSFTFLKPNPVMPINFSIKQALSFEGETGPYCLYTYARMSSILKKGNFNIKKINIENLNFDLLTDKEIKLIKILNEYQEVILDSANKYKISNLTNYSIKISQAFNEYYQLQPILKEEKENIRELRLTITYFVSIILKDVLEILNIEVLEEM